MAKYKPPHVYAGPSVVYIGPKKGAQAAKQAKLDAAAKRAAQLTYGSLVTPQVNPQPAPPPRVPLGKTPFTTAIKQGARAPRKSIVPPPANPTRKATPAHPAVGTGPVKQPPKSQHGAPKGEGNTGNVATSQTVPADRRPTGGAGKGGGGAGRGGLKPPAGGGAGAGGRTTTTSTTTTTQQQLQAPYSYKDFLKASQIPV